MRNSGNVMQKIACVVITLAVLGIAVYCTPIFPFRAVYYMQRYHHDQELCYMDMPKGKDTLSSVDGVLTNYGESHVLIGNTILIPLKLLLDKDLLRNYTAKAGLLCPDGNYYRHPDVGCDLWIEKR